MATVLVVGAGASLGQAEAFRPRRQREHPPLDRDFFQKAAGLGTSNEDVARRVRDFADIVRRDNLFEDPFDSRVLSLEQYFADVYYEVASTRSQSAFEVFVALLRLYNLVLGETTNWIAARSKLGPLDHLVRKEKSLDPSLTVLTFNQDLLFENVALSFPHYSDTWCLPSLYGEALGMPQLSQDPNPPFRIHRGGCPHRPPFTLLKLHGSLNWVVKSRDRNPSMNTLFPRRADREVSLLNTTQVHDDPSYRTQRPGPGRKTWYLWPLVIPPIYDKQRLTGLKVIQEVWRQARESLETATRIVFVGYSIPDADVSAAQMLRRAFAANADLESVHCINPDPALVGKLKERLGAQVVTLYENLDCYLRHAF